MSTEYQRPPVRVALMGLGRAMFTSHYPVFKAHPALFKIVAACDILKERRDIIAKDFPECRMFRQIEDMLDESDIDLVDIATPTVEHVSHAMRSLEKGFWTLLESPMTISMEDANLLRGAAAKARNRLIIFERGLFSPDYLLAKQMMNDPRLGEIYQIRMRREDYVRRDDWQTVKRMGGGACFYEMTNMIIQVLKLLPFPPIQLWSELKRIASLGDSEDYVHMNLRTRSLVSASVEFNGGCLAEDVAPSFEVRGDRGTFKVMPGASEGVLTAIEPDFHFPRRRSSVRTPQIEDSHEEFPVVKIPISLPKGTMTGASAFWKHVYDSVRTAAPFPFQIEDSLEALKFVHLMKKTSPYAI